MKRIIIALVIAAAGFGLGMGASSYDRNAAIARTLQLWADHNRTLGRQIGSPTSILLFDLRADAFESARDLVLTQP